jgi:hypothetical protein
MIQNNMYIHFKVFYLFNILFTLHQFNANQIIKVI